MAMHYFGQKCCTENKGASGLSLCGDAWSLTNRSDVDRCHQVCCRIGLEAGIRLQVHLNGVPHCFADIGDWDIGGMHPFGEAMPE